MSGSLGGGDTDADWGEQNGDRFVRLVFSDEPVARLVGLGARVRGSL
jgi:hypothetical protein